MGYSIATPIKSEKAKKEMMKFLNRHFNPLGESFKQGPIDKGLGYDDGPCRIGFDGIMISDYMISVCAWIALRVGKTKVYPTKEQPNVHGPYKYLRYDGFEDWPLYIVSKWRKGTPDLVKINWIGCVVPQPEFIHDVLGRKKRLKQIEEELKRLDALWTSGKWKNIKSEFAAQRYP